MGQLLTYLLDEFHLLTQDVVLQEATGLKVRGQNPEPADPKGPGLGASPRPRQFPWHPEFDPILRGKTSGRPGRERGPRAGFAPSGDAGPLALLLCQLVEGVAQALQSPIVTVEIEVQREVGRGGLQVQGGQVVDGGLIWWNNSNEFGSLWLFSNEELRSKTRVGWSRRLRTAEVIPLVVTGKEVEGWWEAGRRSLGLFHPNSLEARVRSGGPRRALPPIF